MYRLRYAKRAIEFYLQWIRAFIIEEEHPAGIGRWIPVFAGMTGEFYRRLQKN
jgi:hypothetical protein